MDTGADETDGGKLTASGSSSVFYQKEESVKPPQGTCPTCDTLWREFAHTTAEHVKVIMESRIARSAREKASDEKRAVTIANSGLMRELARMDIREHEALAHEDITSATTVGS